MQDAGRAARCGSPAGFTLVELLVALVILSTGIVLVLEAFQTSLTAVSRTRDALRTDMLVRERVADVERLARVEPPAPPLDGRGRFAGDDRAYAWEQRVETMSPDGAAAGAAAYRVTVSVWRDDASGPRRSVTTVVRIRGTAP